MDSHHLDFICFLVDGKPVLRKSELKSVISKVFEASKGLGARRLALKMRDKYVGLGGGGKNTHSYLYDELSAGRLNVKFTNNIPITPIVAFAPMRSVQCDLID